MGADLIVYCLEQLTDHDQFERLCHDLVLAEGYRGLEPIGGMSDKGRDAESRRRGSATPLASCSSGQGRRKPRGGDPPEYFIESIDLTLYWLELADGIIGGTVYRVDWDGNSPGGSDTYYHAYLRTPEEGIEQVMRAAQKDLRALKKRPAKRQR